MNLAQRLNEMVSNIKEACIQAGYPLNDGQLTQVNNILIPYAEKLANSIELKPGEVIVGEAGLRALQKKAGLPR